MYQNNLLKHKLSGEILRLVKQRENNINTFLQVDKNNVPILKKREWSAIPQEMQTFLINGFDNLEKYEID